MCPNGAASVMDCRRLEIVECGGFVDVDGGRGNAVLYEVQESKAIGAPVRKLYLQDAWRVSTPVLKAGTTVNVVGVVPDAEGSLWVKREVGFLIVEPDRLVSATSVVGTQWCDRKVVFSEHFRFPGSNVHAFKGNIAHDMIAEAMQSASNDVSELFKKVITNPAVLEQAYELGLTQKELEAIGTELIEPIRKFQAKLWNDKTIGSGKYKGVVDIEDAYWSPQFGIKGKVDCTIEFADADGDDERVLPVEFKTQGKRRRQQPEFRPDHYGQVYLYSLMMGLVESKPNGFLHYIRDMETRETNASWNDLQHLIMARNKIVAGIEEVQLVPGFEGLSRPYMVDFDRHCSNCEYRTVCALSLKNDDNKQCGGKSAIPHLVDSLNYLNEKEIGFAKSWLEFLRYEIAEDEHVNANKSLWLDSVDFREHAGKCIGYLKLRNQNSTGTTNTFWKPYKNQKPPVCPFVEKDFCVVGTLNDPCVGYAFVEAIRYLDENGEFEIDVSMERSINGRHSKGIKYFTIDKISSSSVGTLQYVSLTRLMEDQEHSKKIRNHLIMGEAPKVADKSPLLKNLAKNGWGLLAKLNKTQRDAVTTAMNTDSILLVHGSPGCGKTATLVTLIKCLVRCKQNVLVTAYTNNALDNILLQLQKNDVDFIRLGSAGSLQSSELERNSSIYIRQQCCTVDELKAAYNSKPVVASTLLGLKHPVFKQRKFDYCVIDEGAQALPTTVIGALLLAEKCIIFGDPNQLAATVKSRRAKALNLPDSIFGLLAHPKFSVNLNVQYRMNQVIMKVANQLLYDNSMQCGSESQALRMLKIDLKTASPYVKTHVCTTVHPWLVKVISRKEIRSVQFLDTAALHAYDKKLDTSVYNVVEQWIVFILVKTLVACDVLVDNIGIVTPYRGQVKKLREALASCVHMNLNAEVNTVDQYQGREKEIIIVSFAKSFGSNGKDLSDEELKGSILNDIRRLNVAITRAKKKVILVGNSETLTRFEACRKLLNLLDNVEQKIVLHKQEIPDWVFETELEGIPRPLLHSQAIV